ncbi:cell division protein FtsI [Cellulomonas chitinilytica]|uniref:Beta-lactamase n=1 Tax=Cellulomonas chitinilytica TaxID=398759 RepID=A0A919P5H5_9CELL|nr:cell division protein FtsI [Cellulomonas chitinilytica]
MLPARGPAARPGWRRFVAVGTVGVLAAAGLAACSSKPPGPDAAAKTLAAALTSGSFTAVEFADGSGDAAAAADARTAAYEGLDPLEPKVTFTSAASPKDDPDTATAKFAFTWDVDDTDDDWTYTTTAHLTRDAEDESVWRVTWSPALLAPDLVAGEKLTTTRVRAERANVLGAGGVPIVEPRPVWHLGVDKTHTDAAGQDAAARWLAVGLGIDADEYAAKVAAAGPKAFVEAITVRQGDPAYDIPALTTAVGVSAVSDTLPLAPTRVFARPILGTVGPATAEIVEKSEGAIAAGDTAGLSGLQRQFDAQLRGVPGITVNAVSADGAAKRELFSKEPVAGTPLATTLDPNLQQAAEDILAGVGPASAIVAVRPSTGDVVAAASGPGGEGQSTATLGQFAPGSTFKVATTLALLRGGLTADSTVSCPATTTVDGRVFQNFPGYPADKLGDVPLRTAFANSCNTAFIGSRDKADQNALIDAAGSLGLVPDADLGFAAFLGAVPADSDGTDHAASMIGQGRILASPLGMATVAASVGAGHTVTPHLVTPAEGATSSGGATPSASEGGEGSASPSATPRPAVPLTTAEAQTLQGLMRAVVTEGGATFLQDVPAPEVAAKTGTAQFGEDGNLQNHVWMIATHGDLAVAVFVDVGDYGSTTAGPLLEQFLRAAG